ncbi:hypothetical protein [Rhodococcus phage P19]|nr:hypothetical protein [Rhodococcus phage P19]
MPRHPGDPRSNVLGEQEYDEHEYPNVHYTPPAEPPVTGNVNNYTQFRGHEQHGVAFTRNPQEDSSTLPYAEEQRAQDKYNDPKITPRDLSNTPPIRVVHVDAPDLLYRRKARVFSYTVQPNGIPVQVLQTEHQRKKVVVSVLPADPAAGAYFTYATSPDATTIQSACGITSPYGGGGALIESTYTGQLYFTVPPTFGPSATVNTALVVSVWVEYTQSDGETLLT